MAKKLLVALVLVNVLALFLWGAARQFRMNANRQHTDQQAYLEYAKQSRAHRFGHVPSRNYMPVYPAVQSWFYREGMTDEEYFRRGKRVNVVLALLTVLTLTAALAWRNHPWDAAVAASAATLSMVAFKAPAFQPELLFYAISLLMFIAQLHLVLRPSWGRAVVAGALTGLAYLTKGSVPPLAMLTALCLIGRAIEGAVRGRSAERMRAPALAAAVFCLATFVVLFPYLLASKQMYGRWFCENNMHFFWCDSWNEAVQMMRDAGGEKGFYALPRSEMPGPVNYWRTHTVGEIVGRVSAGFHRMYEQHIKWGYGYARFLLVYGVCLGFIGYAKRREAAAWLRREGNAWAALYGAGLFIGYPFLCAWYTYIDNSRRFALILFYPALYLAVRGLKLAREADVEWSLFGAKLRAGAVSGIVFLVLIEYVIFDYVYRVQTMDGTY